VFQISFAFKFIHLCCMYVKFDFLHRLRVLENRVLRRTFGPKKAKVVGGWRGLHNEVFHKLYASLNVIRVTKSKRMRWAGSCSSHGRGEKCVQCFRWKT